MVFYLQEFLTHFLLMFYAKPKAFLVKYVFLSNSLDLVRSFLWLMLKALFVFGLQELGSDHLALVSEFVFEPDG